MIIYILAIFMCTSIHVDSLFRYELVDNPNDAFTKLIEYNTFYDDARSYYVGKLYRINIEQGKIEQIDIPTLSLDLNRNKELSFEEMKFLINARKELGEMREILHKEYQKSRHGRFYDTMEKISIGKEKK